MPIWGSGFHFPAMVWNSNLILAPPQPWHYMIGEGFGPPLCGVLVLLVCISVSISARISISISISIIYSCSVFRALSLDSVGSQLW